MVLPGTVISVSGKYHDPLSEYGDPLRSVAQLVQTGQTSLKYHQTSPDCLPSQQELGVQMGTLVPELSLFPAFGKANMN